MYINTIAYDNALYVRFSVRYITSDSYSDDKARILDPYNIIIFLLGFSGCNYELRGYFFILIDFII